MNETTELNHELEAQNTMVIKAIEGFAKQQLQTLDGLKTDSAQVKILKGNIETFLNNPLLKPNVLSAKGIALSQETNVATTIYMEKSGKKIQILPLENSDWSADSSAKTADGLFQIGNAVLSGVEFGSNI
jgi:hypothetical protein